MYAEVIDPTNKDSENLWNDYVASSPDSTVYHTLWWRDIIERSFGMYPTYILTRSENGVEGVLPLFIVRNPIFGCKLISLPFDGCYGGPLFKTEKAALCLVRKGIELTRQKRCKFFEIRNRNKMPLLDGCGFVENTPMIYHQLDLVSVEENWRNSSDVFRRAVKKAKKEGLVVNVSDKSSDIEEFYMIMAKMFKSFGTPVFGVKYIRNIMNILPTENRTLLLARKDDKVIGGILLLHYKSVLIYKYGACLSEFLPLRPYNALLWHAIEFGVNIKCAVFNTGSHDPEDAGLLRFKMTMGGIQAADHFYDYSPDSKYVDFSSYFNKYRLEKAIWKRLPLKLSMTLGHAINRWLC